jgi:uncharacterized protein
MCWGHSFLPMAFGCYRVPSRQSGRRRVTLGALAGAMGGLTGGMAALPGPFVTIWCSLQGWDKTRQRGVTQAFILIMQIVALGTLYAMGSGGRSYAAIHTSAWAYLPAALLGTVIGLSVFRRLSDRQFAVAVNVLMIASGLGFLV